MAADAGKDPTNLFEDVQRVSQSFNFLLPLGFAIGAFSPAILALYLARRRSLKVQLNNHKQKH